MRGRRPLNRKFTCALACGYDGRETSPGEAGRVCRGGKTKGRCEKRVESHKRPGTPTPRQGEGGVTRPEAETDLLGKRSEGQLDSKGRKKPKKEKRDR